MNVIVKSALAGAVLAITVILLVEVYTSKREHSQNGKDTQQPKAKETTLAWPKEPADFKGLKFGMSLREVKQVLGSKNCTSLGSMQQCEIKTDLLRFLVDFDSKGKLFQIRAYFAPGDFSEVEEVFVAKYGKPTYAFDRTLSNEFGASFQQNELRWRGDRMAIVLRRFRKDYDEASEEFKGSYDLKSGELEVYAPASPDDSRKKAAEKTHVLD